MLPKIRNESTGKAAKSTSKFKTSKTSIDRYQIAEANRRSLHTVMRYPQKNYDVILQHKFKRNLNFLDSKDGSPRLSKNLSMTIKRSPVDIQRGSRAGPNQSLEPRKYGKSDQMLGSVAERTGQAYQMHKINEGSTYGLTPTKIVKNNRRYAEQMVKLSKVGTKYKTDAANTRNAGSLERKPQNLGYSSITIQNVDSELGHQIDNARYAYGNTT